MGSVTTNLTDAEWEEKFNSPRERLFKEIFGDKKCEVKDLSPKVVIEDKNFGNSEKDFMAKPENRVTVPMNSDMCGVRERNEQLMRGGRIETKVAAEDLKAME